LSSLSSWTADSDEAQTHVALFKESRMYRSATIVRDSLISFNKLS